MSGISRNQWIGIAIVILGVIANGSTNLTPVVGAGLTQILVNLATLLNTGLGGVIIVLGGNQTQAREVIQNPANQEQIVKAVAAMPGLEPLQANRNANAVVAQLAVDPSATNISAKPSDAAAVMATASASEPITPT